MNMAEPDEISRLVKEAISDAHVQVEDMTGTGDHFQGYVVSRMFEGKTLIEQHQLVQRALQAAMEDGRIHAVQIKTETPAQWAKKRPAGDDFKIIG